MYDTGTTRSMQGGQEMRVLRTRRTSLGIYPELPSLDDVRATKYFQAMTPVQQFDFLHANYDTAAATAALRDISKPYQNPGILPPVTSTNVTQQGRNQKVYNGDDDDDPGATARQCELYGQATRAVQEREDRAARDKEDRDDRAFRKIEERHRAFAMKEEREQLAEEVRAYEMHSRETASNLRQRRTPPIPGGEGRKTPPQTPPRPPLPHPAALAAVRKDNDVWDSQSDIAARQ